MPIETPIWTETRTSLLHILVVAPFLMWMAYRPSETYLMTASLIVATTHLYRLGMIQKKRGTFLSF